MAGVGGRKFHVRHIELGQLLKAVGLGCVFAHKACNSGAWPCSTLDQRWARDEVSVHLAKGLFLPCCRCPQPHRVSHQMGTKAELLKPGDLTSSKWVQEN